LLKNDLKLRHVAHAPGRKCFASTLTLFAPLAKMFTRCEV
jgi:hypothetical protein